MAHAMPLFRRPQPVHSEPCGLGYADLLRLPDEEVMRHLALGHHDALAVLYDRYHRLVLAVALRVLRDRGEAQDVCQDVFMKLFRTVAQYDAGKGMTRMWILRFAYQLSFNRRRYLRVRSFQTSGVDAAQLDVAAPAADSRMSAGETAWLVRQLLARLGDRQRRTLELAYFQGLTMDEIAVRTGETVGNVRHQYYRGLARLKVLLAEHRATEALGAGDVTDASARQLA